MATQAMPKPDTDVLPTLSPPGLVGRQRELAALGDALAASPAVVLVEGEAGIGKSRLVQEFLTSPGAGEGRVLVGACPPYREPQTLAPIVDAIRRATGTVKDLPLSKLAGALRPLFPEWVDDLPAALESAEDATAARHRLFRALAELLDCTKVGVLVVEDAHCADEATLEFLLFLTSRRDPHLSLVVTYRPEDVPTDSLLRRLSSRLPVGTTQLRLTLPPLDVSATADLVSSMLGDGSLSETFAAFLHAHTEGLPLAIEESVRVMYDRADLARRDGEWVRRHLEWIEVPPTLRDAVMERAGRLGPDAQAVLRAVAVVADPTGEATVLAVARLPDDRGRAGLAEARACGLLGEDAQGLVAFRHMLAARAVYEAIPVADRRTLHLSAGEALEGYTPQPVARLARHFREAGDSDRWCRYAEQAADLALTAGDEATAVVLLYDLVTQGGLPAGDVARLMNKIPLNLTGPDRNRGLVATLRSILETEKATSEEEEGRLRAQLGRLLVALDDWNAAPPELERAVACLNRDPVATARAMTLLGWPLGSDWPASRHLTWLRRAARIDTARIPPAERMLLLVNRATALLLLGEEEGWAEAERIPTESRTAQERMEVTRGLLNTGELAMLWGRYARARELLERCLDLARTHQYLRLRDAGLVTRAHLDWFTGAWETLSGRVASLAAADDVEALVSYEAVLVAGLVEAATGAFDRAHTRLEFALGKAREQGAVEYCVEPAAALARVQMAEGRVADALTVTDEPIDVVATKDAWIWATDLAPVRVEALLAADRIDEAGRLVTGFARGLHGRDAPGPKAALALCRALLTDGKGEHARAAGQFGRAAAAWGALPRPYDALLARERQAHCLLEVGPSGDGIDLLTQVLKGLSDLGARTAAGRVLRTLRERGVRARRPGAGRPSYGDQLSPRELEVVRLLVTGKTTNQEIARVLFLSPKTVARHLESAMHKLNAGSRTALALAAVEAGMVSAE